MKKIKITKKTAKYFEYPGAIIIFGSIFLIPYLIKKLDFLNVASFKLWDCPGSFLCDVPFIKNWQHPAENVLILLSYSIVTHYQIFVYFILSQLVLLLF